MSLWRRAHEVYLLTLFACLDVGKPCRSRRERGAGGGHSSRGGIHAEGEPSFCA